MHRREGQRVPNAGRPSGDSEEANRGLGGLCIPHARRLALLGADTFTSLHGQASFHAEAALLGLGASGRRAHFTARVIRLFACRLGRRRKRWTDSRRRFEVCQ
jgi:hypothetical protein